MTALAQPESGRLTSAVRVPTAPLRPGGSGSFGHEVAGSMPESGKRAAAVQHCHVSVHLTQPDEDTDPAPARLGSARL